MAWDDLKGARDGSRDRVGLIPTWVLAESEPVQPIQLRPGDEFYDRTCRGWARVVRDPVGTPSGSVMIPVEGGRLVSTEPGQVMRRRGGVP